MTDLIVTSNQNLSESIVTSNQNKIGTTLYTKDRKNIFKPNLIFRESWKNSKLNRLVNKIFDLKEDWSIQTGSTIVNKNDDQVQISYCDKNNYKIRFNKRTKIHNITKDIKDLFNLVHQDTIKDGFQQVYVPKELKINEESHRTFEIYQDRYVRAITNLCDLIFIISGQGTGKTYQIVKKLVEAIKAGKRVLIISNRISLGTTILRNMLDAMKELEIDVELNENKLYFYKKSRKSDLSNGDNLIISPESIVKMMDGQMSLAKYDIIWIDECKKVMNDYGSSQTLNGIRQSSLNILQHYIQTCDKVYISDADMTDDVISWVEKLRSPTRSTSHIIWNQEKTDQTDTYLYESSINMNTRLYDQIENHKSVYLSFTSVKEAEGYYIELRTKYPNLKILKITGESAESTMDTKITKMTALMDCNQEWKKYDIVMTTPCIVYGTSFDEVHFDEVFYYYQNTLTGELACQSLHRVRKLKNNRINMCVPFDYRPYLITEEDEFMRIMNGDLGLLKGLNISEGVRESILSTIGCKWDKEGNRIINTKDLL